MRREEVEVEEERKSLIGKMNLISAIDSKAKKFCYKGDTRETVTNAHCFQTMMTNSDSAKPRSY